MTFSGYVVTVVGVDTEELKKWQEREKKMAATTKAGCLETFCEFYMKVCAGLGCVTIHTDISRNKAYRV